MRRRLWIACAVAAMGHVAFLHVVGMWTPRTAGDRGGTGLSLVFVSVPAALAGEEAIANGKRGATQSAPVPASPKWRGIPQQTGLPTGASHQQEGSPSGISLSEDVDGVRFYTSREVDRQALPASALELLDVMALVTEPSLMVVRVYTDATGAAVRAEIVRVSEGNHAAAARLALILMETRFVPAKRLGADVAAVRELEFQIEPV